MRRSNTCGYTDVHVPESGATGVRIRWVPPAEARAIYKFSRRKMEELIRLGVLRVRKFGPRCRRVAVPMTDIEE